MEITPDKLAKLTAWRASLAPMRQWRDYEAAGRVEVANLFFPTPALGTQRIDLPGGEKLKLIFKYNYSLGNKDLVDPVLEQKVAIETQVKATLDAIASLGGEGPLLAERLIKWKPELNEPEYKKLRAEVPIEAEAKKLLDAILVAKPATPQLEIEEPKK